MINQTKPVTKLHYDKQTTSSSRLKKKKIATEMMQMQWNCKNLKTPSTIKISMALPILKTNSSSSVPTYPWSPSI